MSWRIFAELDETVATALGTKAVRFARDPHRAGAGFQPPAAARIC